MRQPRGNVAYAGAIDYLMSVGKLSSIDLTAADQHADLVEAHCGKRTTTDSPATRCYRFGVDLAS